MASWTPSIRQKNRWIDLHLHTHQSDGTFSPEEVVRRARARGLAAISVTDHDTLAGIESARKAAGSDLEILSGVEITATFRDRELHILGYGFEEDAADLAAYLARARARRQSRMQAMIDRLRERGIAVTLEEVQAAAGAGASIGRPHLAEVLVQRKVVRSLREAFQRYLGDNAPCFVKQGALAVSEAVQLIRWHGGIAVLAHPHRIVEDAWIPDLVEQGVQGIEAYHSDLSAEVIEHYRGMADRLGVLVTGGSDCHGLRKAGGHLIGTVPVPYEVLERLKSAIAG